MSQMWLDIDIAVNVPVNLLPLIDDTDFKTRETGIVYNQAGMDLVWNFVTTAGVTTQTAVTPTTAGDYDWTHSGDAMYKLEITASGGASINNDAEGFGWFTGVCTGVLPWRGPVYGFRAAGLNNLLIDDAFSATRGLAGTALPAAAADAAGGVAISDAGGLDLDAKLANTNEITVARMGALTDWINGGRLDLILDIIAADVINIDGAAMRGTDGANTVVPDAAGFLPTALEVADAVWDEILTGATHNIATSAGRRLRGIQEFQGYENGSIWIDTVNGTAGTIDYENGTVEQPVLTLADALTLNASLGFNRFTIFNGSTITLVSTFNNYLFTGVGWTLALGGQNTGGSHFIGPTVSGIATGTETTFVDAHMGNCTIDIMHLENCSLNGTLIVGAAGDQHISSCHSDIAGTGTPVFDAGAAIANSSINFRDYSGGMEFQNLGQAGTDAVSIEGNGQVVLNANCIGGSINIRGNFELTDNSSTTTVNDDARYDAPRHVDLTWDEVLTGATHNITDSAGRRLRTNQEFGSYQDDSVWIDTINGSAGTTDYESGTILNKVDSIADANTIGTSLGISGRAIIPGSSITLAASQDNQNFWGNNWILALGGQSISATHIEGANVSGICSGASLPEFHECHIGSVTVPPCRFVTSDIEGTITLPVGTVDFHHSAGEAGGILDYGVAVANTTVNWTDFSGELVIDNLGQNGTDILNIRGHGKITFNASCIGGTVNWDGHFTITDNGSGITFNSDDISSNVESALTAIAVVDSNVDLLVDGVIKANTAGAFHIQMLDASDDPVTSQAVTVTRRLDNGSFGATTGTATNTDSNGVSYFSYVAGDVNGTDAVAFKFSATGAKDTYLFFKLSV